MDREKKREMDGMKIGEAGQVRASGSGSGLIARAG